MAVIATFRRLGVSRRLATLVEGESLANDGTALVLFSATVAAISGGGSVSETAEAIAIAVVTSIGIGLAAGWLASRLIALVDDLAIELTISIAAAYGTYLLADGLGQSGIIATVVAGVVIGTYGRSVGLSPRALEALDVVWELIAFLLTAFAFLLVGLAISVGDLLAGASSILWGLVGILVARVVVVYGLLGGIAQLIGERAHWPKPPIGWLHVMFWAGLRGAVAVAMALSLPAAGVAPADRLRRRAVHVVRAGHDGGAGRRPNGLTRAGARCGSRPGTRLEPPSRQIGDGVRGGGRGDAPSRYAQAAETEPDREIERNHMPAVQRNVQERERHRRDGDGKWGPAGAGDAVEEHATEDRLLGARDEDRDQGPGQEREVRPAEAGDTGRATEDGTHDGCCNEGETNHDADHDGPGQLPQVDPGHPRCQGPIPGAGRCQEQEREAEHGADGERIEAGARRRPTRDRDRREARADERCVAPRVEGTPRGVAEGCGDGCHRARGTKATSPVA